MRKSGFTLIELLSCIVIIGILAAASTGFIKNGVSFYMEATANGQTADSEKAEGRLCPDCAGTL